MHQAGDSLFGMDHGGVVHLQIPGPYRPSFAGGFFGGQIDGNLPGQDICWIRLRDRLCWPVMVELLGGKLEG